MSIARQCYLVVIGRLRHFLANVRRQYAAVHRPWVLAFGAFDGQHSGANDLDPRSVMTALRAGERDCDGVGVWHNTLHITGLVKLLGQTRSQAVQKVRRGKPTRNGPW